MAVCCSSPRRSCCADDDRDSSGDSRRKEACWLCVSRLHVLLRLACSTAVHRRAAADVYRLKGCALQLSVVLHPPHWKSSEGGVASGRLISSSLSSFFSLHCDVSPRCCTCDRLTTLQRLLRAPCGIKRPTCQEGWSASSAPVSSRASPDGETCSFSLSRSLFLSQGMLHICTTSPASSSRP